MSIPAFRATKREVRGVVRFIGVSKGSDMWEGGLCGSLHRVSQNQGGSGGGGRYSILETA